MPYTVVGMYLVNVTSSSLSLQTVMLKYLFLSSLNFLLLDWITSKGIQQDWLFLSEEIFPSAYQNQYFLHPSVDGMVFICIRI